MRIGETASQTGLTVDAIRFYERRGLLPHPPRTQGGYRQYAKQHIADLQFIQQMQALGFSLQEVRELISLRAHGHSCAQVRDLISAKLSAVISKLAELSRLERDLRKSLNRCNREMRKHRKRAHSCPVLEQARLPRRSK